MLNKELITKEELQKLLDGADENILNNSYSYVIGMKQSYADIVKTFLHNSQKARELTLHDKLIKYICDKTSTCHVDPYKGKADYNSTYTYEDILIHTSKDHGGILVEYDINEIICETHEQIFDAIKLFEKWSQE